MSWICSVRSKKTLSCLCLPNANSCGVVHWHLTDQETIHTERSSILSLLIYIHRTHRTAVKRASWCVTSIKVVVTVASSIMWFTASWSPTARSGRSYWSHRTGVTPPAAGKRSLNLWAKPVQIVPALLRDTGLVSDNYKRFLKRACTILIAQMTVFGGLNTHVWPFFIFLSFI